MILLHHELVLTQHVAARIGRFESLSERYARHGNWCAAEHYQWRAGLLRNHYGLDDPEEDRQSEAHESRRPLYRSL